MRKAFDERCSRVSSLISDSDRVMGPCFDDAGREKFRDGSIRIRDWGEAVDERGGVERRRGGGEGGGVPSQALRGR